MKSLLVCLILVISYSVFASPVKQITEKVILFSGNPVMMIWHLEDRIAKRVKLECNGRNHKASNIRFIFGAETHVKIDPNEEPAGGLFNSVVSMGSQPSGEVTFNLECI